MNMICLNKKFALLRKSERQLKYQFEPHTVKQKTDPWHRHIYFEELKSDFINEVSAYGFSPFIHQTYDVQKRNNDIMKYKRNNYVNGYFNYVKKKNIGDKNQRAKLIQSATCQSIFNINQSSSQGKVLKLKPESLEANTNKKKTKSFVSNALRHLIQKKEPDEEQSTVSQEPIVPVMKEKDYTLKKIDYLKERFNQSLRRFSVVHPFVFKANSTSSSCIVPVLNNNEASGKTLLRRYEPEFDKTLNPIGLTKKNEKDIENAKESFKESEYNDILGTRANSIIPIISKPSPIKTPLPRRKKPLIPRHKRRAFSTATEADPHIHDINTGHSDIFSKAKLFKPKNLQCNPFFK